MSVYYLLQIFFIYSFLGWILEVIEAAVKTSSFINKGFLNGAICPVYGFGMVLMTVCLRPWYGNPLYLMMGCLLIGTGVEYLTGFLLEKLTHSKWWDYSHLPWNLKGRICLFSSCLWGVAGIICLEINRFLSSKVFPMEIKLWNKIGLILLSICFLLDLIASLVTVFSLQNKFKKMEKIGKRILAISSRLGGKIFDNVYMRMTQRKKKKEVEKIRQFYREERKKKLLSWLKKRMILAAPDMAPDEETLAKLERQHRLKKRKLFTRIVLNRILWTAISVLSQIVWLVILLTKFATSSVQISLCMTVLSLLISLYIISKNENSAYKIGWIMIIMTFPVLGGMLYLFFGNKNPARNLRRRLEQVHEEQKGQLKQKEEIEKKLEEIDERAAGRNCYLLKKTDYPVWQNTKTTYYPLGDLMLPDILEELEKAEHFIFLEYFIVEDGIFWDSIREVLVRKAKEGVDVRMIYDDVGCLMLLPKKYYEELERSGIKCIAFNRFKPIFSLVLNNRDHRKIMVIDGHTAFTGGINLADEYINMAEKYGHWKDTGIKLQGDAAANFTVMFLEMWNAFRKTETDFSEFLPDTANMDFGGKGFVQPFCDTPLDDEPTAENLYIDILNQASRYVYIFTPYLIIGDTMRHALCMAAARGVDVKIVTPGIPDKKLVFRLTRSNYKELLKAGVEIYEYTPGFLHAKSYVSDDKVAVVGTINMDYRSLYLHFECGAYLFETESIEAIKEDVLETIQKSKKIEQDDLKQGLLARLFDAILAIISPLV